MSYELSDGLIKALDKYLHDLGDVEPTNLHGIFIAHIEKALLQQIMGLTGNQTKAARWLGLNRNTLHKKLVQYDLMES